MSDRKAIRQIIIDLLQDEVGEKFDSITDSTNLRSELGLDSVDVVSLIAQIERRFRIRLTRQEIENLVSVGNVLDLLHAKIGDASAAA
jgi:acyl carrier protein